MISSAPLHRAIDNEYFHNTAFGRKLDDCAGSTAQKRRGLGIAALPVERLLNDAVVIRGGPILRRRVKHELGTILPRVLPQTYEQQATFSGERRVCAAFRVQQIISGGIVAMFIGKNSLQYQYLFTARMHMRCKTADGIVVHDARNRTVFAALTVQALTPHRRVGTRVPRERRDIDHDGNREVGMGLWAGIGQAST